MKLEWLCDKSAKVVFPVDFGAKDAIYLCISRRLGVPQGQG